MNDIQVPFFRPDIGEREVEEVIATLRSGWLTTGPKVHRFEQEFASAVGAAHAVAVNSCTAALHLAVEALDLSHGQAVLVPTLTFAATAEVVRYCGAIPILVDCDPVTGNMDLNDAQRKLAQIRSRDLWQGVSADTRAVGMMPVHVGGMMMEMDAVTEFAAENQLWVVEDAAHAFPAAWRRAPDDPWQQCGGGTANVTCFSFYANKTITTGEGGMATTDDFELAERMRLMSLHGLSHDAWGRYSGNGSWDYKIVAPGYKYNFTDIAAAIGIHQLARAEEMRLARETIACNYLDAFANLDEIELPCVDSNRIHAWHLFPIRLHLERLTIGRDAFIDELKSRGIGVSVHWRPLHLHPYYQRVFDWQQELFPVATAMWQRQISLPIFSGMRQDEIVRVVDVVMDLCSAYSRKAEPELVGLRSNQAQCRV